MIDKNEWFCCDTQQLLYEDHRDISIEGGQFDSRFL